MDHLGAYKWWKSDHPRRLRALGIQLLPALPARIGGSIFGRGDLRLHRKIAVIDGAVAWTGSMNMVDPVASKSYQEFGPWVDANLRLEGPVVAALGLIAVGDWHLETNAPFEPLLQETGIELSGPAGEADLQVVASGPDGDGDGLLHMLLALIASAETEVVVTTPYFVPDVSMLRALLGAAARGVRVTLVVPHHVDSLLTRWASRSYFDDLLGAGIEIFLFKGGLLHTKSITVDGAISMFGTANFDHRSLFLNYEISLFVYDRQLSAQIHKLQREYVERSDQIDPEHWQRRPIISVFGENAARLFSPLL